jgi:4-amino-4-deoxy-L-arabinose transferase-like glycosyltransferase
VKPAWAVAALLAVAAVPRAVDLASPGLTYDEYYDFEDSRAFCADARPLEPVSDGYLNGQAPFFLACAAYALFGTHEATARGLAAAASLLAIGATYLLAQRLLPSRWALVAALLLGLSPFFLSASRLAFSHGHVFAVPCLVFALREVLASRARLHGARAALACGALAGFAAGCDLLAVPWAVTLLGLGLGRLRGRAAAAPRARFAARFSLAWAAGLALASPMYLAHPLAAARDVAARLAFWDAQQEHLWLGAEVASVPAYYYGLVALVKISPPELLLGALSPVGRRPLAARVLLPCLWPILYLSLKNWKSPFYLTAFLPLVAILAADTLRRLARAAPRLRRLAPAAVTLVAAVQVATIADAHPDYLMLGIRYGERLYGDFQGPAVSHGQWVRAALQRVHADAGGADPVVVVPAGYAPGQVEHYARRLGLSRVHTTAALKRGLNPRHVEYAVVSHDVLVHAEGRQHNGALLRLAADSARFREVATLRSSGFAVARVFRRVRADAPRAASDGR